MDMTLIGMLVAGLLLLAVGGEILVRGASKLALIGGISPLVIGLTVVAFGTSAPELAVSIQAGLTGNANIGVANVVGSNIFNILFILGICAAILPLTVSQQLIRLDVPLMIGVSILVYLMALDGRISFWDGALLATGVIVYTVWAIRKSRQENAAIQAEYAEEFGEPPGTRHSALDVAMQFGLVIAGLLILVLGSRWLVDGAVALAQVLGVSDVVIGLTIVAVGTSLPEVATSIVAAVRGERDIAIGNIVGSNLFNLLSILGFASMATPGGMAVAQSVLRFDMIVMLAVALACLPIFFSGWQIARWEGWLFFGSYIAYTTYLVLNATQSALLPFYTNLMLYGFLPAITIVLTVVGVRAIRTNGSGSLIETAAD
ncbi:MAG: calcium/sodium antiporter [Caldilineaceae bacterium]|nr:calcium/sodium antiporter [Caldilineaceae bacterium]